MADDNNECSQESLDIMTNDLNNDIYLNKNFDNTNNYRNRINDVIKQRQ